MINRRNLLRAGAAFTLVWQTLPAAGLATSMDPRFVLLILRGGVDGLTAVPAYGDPSYRKARGDLALARPGVDNGVRDLDGFFGLHPSFSVLHSLYQQNELAVVHAVAPPYRDRSHFAGQDVLETGIPEPAGSSDGWLYRALGALPGSVVPQEYAMAVGGAVPRVLRGAQTVGAWSPDRLPEPDDDTMARVLALYQHDATLGPKLATMLKTESMMGSAAASGNARSLTVMAKAAAQFLRHPSGPRMAVIESGGWDTHANQAGQLANRFATLDGVLGEFKDELGDVWQHTVVVMVTEFGRTVAMNGTRGSDHGVAGMAFAAGGCINGGRVIANWPGLSSSALYQGRDLKPTTDVRSLFKTVLVGHMGADENAVDEVVFPDSRVPMLEDLKFSGSTAHLPRSAV
jgi:uncharacterized protein (DUF1501 family)